MPSPTDQLLGTLAVRHGFVSEAQVQALLEELPEGRSLGQVLRERGLIPESALPTLQRELSMARFLRAERGFAHLCVERGILTAEVARVLLEEQRRAGNTYRLGERMVQEGRIERPALEGLLEELFARLAAGNAPANSEPTASNIIRSTEAGTPGSEVMKAVEAQTPPAPPPLPPTSAPQVPRPPLPKSASRDGGTWTLTPASQEDEPAPDGTIARNSNAFPFPSAGDPAPAPAAPVGGRPSAAFPFPPRQPGDPFAQATPASAPGDPLGRATPPPAPGPDPTIALESAQLPFQGQPPPDGTIVLSGAQHPYPPGTKPPEGTIVLDGGQLPYEGSKSGGARRPRKQTKIIDTTPASPDMTFDYEGDDEPAPNPTPQPLPPGAAPVVVTPSPDMTFDYEGEEGAVERTMELDAPPQFGDPNSRTVPIPSPFAQDNALTAPIPSPFSGQSPFPGTPGAFEGSAGFDAGGATLPIQRPAFMQRPPSDSGSGLGSGSGPDRAELGDTMADRTSDLTGTLLNNRYQILARVGQGGMGQVFKADHTLMGRTVAIKVLNSNLVTSQESVARFKREIMTLAKFEHPNVVRLFDAGTTQAGQFYMAMEFVEGEPLSRVLAGSGRLELKRFARLFAQVLQGVGKAHERNIVHRDLKTENLLVTTVDSGAEVTKIMDFGIAKLLSDEPVQSSDPFLTAERVAVGTPEYMSPEQAAGGAQVDHRSDIYSLGVVAFELLTGRLPFEAESPVGYIGKHIVDPPFTFEEAQPGLGYPPAVERFVLKALEKEPSDRYQSAEEMLDALEVALPRDLQDRLRQERSSDPRIPAVPAPKQPQAAPSSGASPRSSRGDDMMTKLLRVGVGLAAVLTLCIGAALAYKTVTRGRPAAEVLAEESWEADYAAGRFADAKAQLEAAKGDVRKEDQEAIAGYLERVAKGEALATELRAVSKAWEAALARLDGAVEQGRHAPAEASLEDARGARAKLVEVQEALKAEGLPEVAGPAPESLKSRETGVGFLLELSTATGLIVQGVHSTAISRLDAIMKATLPQSPVHGRARRLRAKAVALSLLEKAEAELAKSAERNYEEARGNVAQAEKLARTESLTEVMTRVRALREKLVEAEQGDVLAKSRQAVLEALGRGKAARAGRDFTKAIQAFEEARALARKNNLTELAKKAEQEIAGAELESSSFDAFRALPALDPEGEVGALRAAIEAREAYIRSYPRGIEAGGISAALPKHRARLRERESKAKRSAFEDLVSRAKAAAGEDPRLAAELAGKAVALGKAAGFDVAAVQALEKSSKDGLRKSLLAEKLQDFVKVGDVYVCRFEVSNNEYLRFVFNRRKAKQPFEKLWPNHWEAKGDKGLRFYPEGQGLHPVGGISHARAEAYCAWRTEEWQQEVPGVKVRLPTKEEWEAAARGGTQRAYPWGDEWNPDRVIFKRGDEEGSATSRGDAAEALAGHTPNTKIFHLAGNVAEWTSTPGTDDEGLPDLSQRLLKGGSYRSFRKELLRIDASEQGGTQESELHWGFRVVVEFE